MLIRNFIDAFSAGKELANATTWKEAQVVVAKLSILIGAILSILSAFGYPIPLTPEQIGILAGGIGVLVGLFNGTATVVSTKRVGVRPRSEPTASGGNDGGGDSGDASKDSGQLQLDGIDHDAISSVSILDVRGG